MFINSLYCEKLPNVINHKVQCFSLGKSMPITHICLTVVRFQVGLGAWHDGDENLYGYFLVIRKNLQNKIELLSLVEQSKMAYPYFQQILLVINCLVYKLQLNLQRTLRVCPGLRAFLLTMGEQVHISNSTT